MDKKLGRRLGAGFVVKLRTAIVAGFVLLVAVAAAAQQPEE